MSESPMADSRLGPLFARCREEKRSALIGYLPVGYPDLPGSLDAMRTMVDAGSDIIEVGVPYSDPVMDGPTIQDAADQALRSGVRVRDVFTAVEAISEAGGSAVVMTYWNPVLQYGVDAFARDLAGAGSSGFVYAASTMGVTGARDSVSTMAPELCARIRLHSDIPIGVGLGVRSKAQAAEIAGYADGVIVGSALVSAVAKGGDALRGLTAELAEGVRATYAGQDPVSTEVPS